MRSPLASYTFYYCVALPSEGFDDTTPLQGFPRCLVQRCDIYRYILRVLPPTIIELYRPSIATMQHRIAGLARYAIFPLLATELTNISVNHHAPLWVVFADSETRSTVSKWATRQSIPVLVVDRSLLDESQSQSPVTRDMLANHCDSVLNAIKDLDGAAQFTESVRHLQTHRISDHQLSLPIRCHSHNTTLPNELVMFSSGAHFAAQLPALIGSDAVFINAIIESADAVAKLRRHLPASDLYAFSPPPLTLMLTSPGILEGVQAHRRPKKGDKHRISDVLRFYQRQQTYSVMVSDEEFEHLQSSPEWQSVLMLRTGELDAYTNAIATRAASHLCPVFRLPRAVDHVLPSVIRLAEFIRGKANNLRKLRRLATEMFDDLAGRVDKQFIDRIDSPQSHVKIVSDAPLEWLPIRGLPLMLRHSTSRIPTTPGGLAFSEILPPQQLYLTMQDFAEVLVIRSFANRDPLRNDLQHAIEAYKLAGGRKLPVRIVDVRTKNDFVKAMNSYDGALVVFDGHGTHSAHDNVGKLLLADEKIDVWELRKEVRMPPIFVMCACEGHAINRSHVTSGNGLIFCGARTVIASVLPIEAKCAAIFVARLLFRIYQLVSAALELDPPVVMRWDDIFHRLQKMMYVTELIIALTGRLGGYKTWAREAEARSIDHIHSTSSEWYELVLESISDLSGVTRDDVLKCLEESLPFPETLKYLQLGNPETILLVPSKAPAVTVSDIVKR